MKITVSESLLGGKRSPYRFVAMLDDDAKERGGFGSSERAALWDLARMLDIHPATLTVQASITRIGVR